MASYPPKVEDLDFRKLRQSQIWTMADWLGALQRLRSCKTASERLETLRLECAASPTRAQEGYDVIVRRLSPTAVGASTDHEKRFLDMATAVTMATLGDVDKRVESTITSLVAGAAATLKTAAKTAAKKAIADAAEKTAPLVIKDGSKTRKIEGPLPPEFERMVQLGAARKNIMLVGPAGCGKTYLAAKLAAALGLSFADQSCSAGLSESVFTGWLLPVGKGGQFEYVASPFIGAYEGGGVFLFDEMDAADANLLTFLNKALANDSFHLPQRSGRTLVKRHKNFVAIGAANTFGHGADAMYVGRNQLDAATLDRFRTGMVVLDYSQDVEESLVDREVLVWGRAIRRAIAQHSLRRIMSTRTLLDMTDMARAAGWQVAQWENAYFADWTKEERRRVSSVVV